MEPDCLDAKSQKSSTVKSASTDDGKTEAGLIDVETVGKLTVAVAQIVKAGNVEKLSMTEIKAALKSAGFNKDTLSMYKRLIKSIAHDMVQTLASQHGLLFIFPIQQRVGISSEHKTATNTALLFKDMQELKFDMAPDFSTFQSRFGTFTGSLLRGIDLRELGLVVAGGSVLLCLQHNVQPTKVHLRTAFRSSDVDVFAIAGTAKEAEASITRLLKILVARFTNASVLVTDNAISFCVPGYPDLQLVLRYAQSTKALLDCFDVDACCFAFDGWRVVTNDRGRRALDTRAIDTDPQFFSERYITRLVKYAARGFAIRLPESLDVPEIVLVPPAHLTINKKRKPDVAPSEFYHLLLRSGVQLVATYPGSEDIKFDGSCKKVARLLRRDREGDLFIVAKALPMDRKPMSRAEWLRSARPDDHLLERFTSGLAAGLSSR